MKVGALGFALELNKTFSINLQLLGGIWILQTFPSVVIGLYTRWFHRAALIFGWLAGMAYGTVQAYRTSGGGQAHFGGSAAPVFGHTTYIAITALLLNLAVAAVLSVVFKGFGLMDGYDETRPADYTADPVPAHARTARKAKPAAESEAPRVPAVPWSLGVSAEEAHAPAEAAHAAEAAPAVEDDATVVFEIPGSLAGRRRSGEHPLRRK
jgi:hypothetical protein